MSSPPRVGPWKVIRTLGAGGMGVVYHARRGKQQAALKVLAPHLSHDARLLQRFRREAVLAQLVSSPHVAAHLDADLESTPAWIASELVNGPTLAERVRQAPFAGADLHDLAYALLTGLVDIHDAEVLHRDIKPANIMLPARGPVYVDFGIGSATELTSMTSTGNVMGSVGWISPEQVSGERAGTASDVFAVGATLAFAATGGNPFGTGPADAILYRVKNDPPDLSRVPVEMVDLLSSLLDKDPGSRPDARQALDLLRTATSPAAPISLTGGPPSGFVAGANAEPGAEERLWRPDDRTRSHTSIGTSQLNNTSHLTAMDVRSGTATASRRWVWWTAAAAAVLVAAVAAWVVLPGGEPFGQVSDDTPVIAEPAQAATGRSSPTASLGPSSIDDANPGMPKFVGVLRPGKSKPIHRLGSFFLKHRQEVVVLDLEVDPYQHPESDVTADAVSVRYDCDPYCGASVWFGIEDLDTVKDVIFAEHGSRWVVQGTFSVLSAEASTGGYEVSLRAVPAGSKPSHTGAPAPTRAATVPVTIPDGFPLNLKQRNDDPVTGDRSQAQPTRARTGVASLQVCGVQLQPDATDRLVSVATGYEYIDSRELVVFEAAADAVEYLREVRKASTACLSDMVDGGEHVYIPLPFSLGYDDYAFTDLMPATLCCGTYQFVRVGSAVLVRFEGGEVSTAPTEQQWEARTGVVRELAGHLCVFTEAGC